MLCAGFFITSLFTVVHTQTTSTDELEKFLLEALQIIEDFRNYLRITTTQFDHVLNLVTDYIQKEDTILRESVTVKQRLAVTLRYLATGNSYYDLKFSSLIAESLLSRLIPETCWAIYRCLKRYIKSNETYNDFDFGDSKGKPCDPFVDEMPDYKRLGRRISEIKCLEYIWEMENRDKLELWVQRCRLYLVSQIKKGEMPEIFVLINSPVIFGGRAAVTKEFPNMGAIGWKSKTDSPKWQFKCGSTLISDKFALTAAHCSRLPLRHTLDISDPNPHIVRFGVENIDDNEFNVNGVQIDVKIKRFIRHPSYKPPKKYNDIALIELDQVVDFKSNLHPACLWPYSNISHLGTEGILSGWGFTEAGKQATELQTAVVDFIETPKCDKVLEKFHNRNWAGFQETQLCAGKLVGGVDTCQGDSGGPLLVKVPLKTEGNMYQIVGVTSFGIKCGKKNRPGIYSRVSSFIDWIEDTVWGQNNTALNAES